MNIATHDAILLDDAAAKNEKFDELFAALEDLLKRIADTDDPDIRRKRAQVRAEMLAVKNTPPLSSAVTNTPEASVQPVSELEGWGQQALVALAGAAVALSMFRHTH